MRFEYLRAEFFSGGRNGLTLAKENGEEPPRSERGRTLDEYLSEKGQAGYEIAASWSTEGTLPGAADRVFIFQRRADDTR